MNKHENLETIEYLITNLHRPLGLTDWALHSISEGEGVSERGAVCFAGVDARANKQNQGCNFLHHRKSPLTVWIRQCFVW